LPLRLLRVRGQRPGFRLGALLPVIARSIGAVLHFAPEAASLSMETFMKTAVALLSLAVAVLPASGGLAQEASRSLENVTGDVWQFTNNSHQSAVIVTEEGIVVTDPIDAEAAGWLKAEIAEQFGRPITHLVYSHSHADHAAGGAAFGDLTAIAHANAPGAIDGVEIDRRVDKPTAIELGGKTLELVPIVPGHGKDMLVMVVRPENVAFVVDVVSPGRVPYRDLPGVDVDGLIDQIRAVEALEFEILLPGHGRLGDKSDVAEAREYLDWLREEVDAAIDAGKGVDDIKASIDWAPYGDLAMVDQWGPMNVEGMARWLQRN
jgi:glyoxylase-like metal-dependent hydrolase (beta-lactamase superfamily II)